LLARGRRPPPLFWAMWLGGLPSSRPRVPTPVPLVMVIVLPEEFRRIVLATEFTVAPLRVSTPAAVVELLLKVRVVFCVTSIAPR